MRKIALLALGLIAFVSICHAEPRWCSVSQRDQSNTIDYPPIAVAMQVQGEVHARITFHPNGKVEKVEPISGVAILARPLANQLSKWKVMTKESGNELCQALVIADFVFRLPAVLVKEEVEFKPELNVLRITVTRNAPKANESYSVQDAPDRF